MNKQIEALKMAIELCEKSIKGLEGEENSGLCSINDEGIFGDALREYYKLLQACKEALEQTAPMQMNQTLECPSYLHGIKSYPPAPSWQSLNDDEVKVLWKKSYVNGCLEFERITFFALAIEQALKEKNQ